MSETKEQSHTFIRHAGIYLIARGLPGVFAFLSIPLFTRLLDPAAYGRYALIMATVALTSAISSSWLGLALVRFLPAHRHQPKALKSTLLTSAGILIVVGALCAAVICMVPAWHAWRSTAWICWALLAAQTPYDLFCEYTRSQIMPWRFMGLQLTRSFLATFLGAALIIAGAGWVGAAAGLAIGMTLPVVFVYRRDWIDARPIIDRRLLIKILRYSIPLSLTFTLAVVINSSDRFLIAWFKGEDAAGLYSVAVNLTNRTLFLLMMVINMAVYPLAVRAWEDRGREAAQEQMSYNASLLLAVGVPAFVAMGMLAGSISFCFLGQSYRSAASDIIPLVALGAFLAGFKAFHWDAAFQFVHQTLHQVWIVLVAAVINLGMNFVLIPHFGINGAAMASVLAYVISIVLTAVIGRRYFALPMPRQPMIQVILATIAMALVIYPLRSYRGFYAMSLQASAGCAVYAAVLIGQNFLDLRTSLLRKLARFGSLATEPVMLSASSIAAGDTEMSPPLA